MHDEFLGLSVKKHFSFLTTVVTFWATFGIYWATF